MNKITMVFIFIILTHGIYGQDKYLKLVKKYSLYPREVIIPQKSELKLKMDPKSKEFIQGEFEIINDSLLLIGADTIAVQEINTLWVKSDKRKNMGWY